ncbi:MAG: hypothetical protein JRG95_20445 [Deltaproteobacteria bacterium]|nr:hypothetical protein [Deltaproteobacteria bacterium]
MGRVLQTAAVSAVLVLLLWGFADVSTACSVCLAGDPVFSTHGTSAQAEGDFSLFIQAQGWRKDSGLLPHEEEEEEEHHDDEHGEEAGSERNRSQRLDLFLAWTPVDRLTLTLDLPFAFNEIEEIEAGGSTTNRLSGLGDVALSGSYVLWRDREVLPSTWIEGRVFLKTPTGRTTRRKGGVIDPHLQTGTGSWDYGLGLAAVHRFDWGSFYTSAFYRMNEEGDFKDVDYEYGDVALFNLALEVPLGHALGRKELEAVTLGGELNYRWSDFDRADGEKFRDSGGSVLYATPSVRFRLPFSVRTRPVSLRIAVQLPVTSSWLNGDQDEKEVWMVGFTVPF